MCEHGANGIFRLSDKCDFNATFFFFCVFLVEKKIEDVF